MSQEFVFDPRRFDPGSEGQAGSKPITESLGQAGQVYPSHGRVHYRVNSDGEQIDVGEFEAEKTNPSKFVGLFSNRFASLIKRDRKGDWHATSQFHFLTDDEILHAIAGKNSFLRAVRADVKTQLVAITLAAGSYYRTKDGLGKLRDCLRCLGIAETKLYRFADSTDWQLFFYLRKPVKSERLDSLLCSYLRRNGIVPGTAGLSLFASSGYLCIPLQPGFCWINDEGQVIASRNEISLESALAMFFCDFDKCAVNGALLIGRLEAILAREEA